MIRDKIVKVLQPERLHSMVQKIHEAFWHPAQVDVEQKQQEEAR